MAKPPWETTLAAEQIASEDRVSSVTDPVTGTISYTYGLAGERKSMTLPGGCFWAKGYGACFSRPRVRARWPRG